MVFCQERLEMTKEEWDKVFDVDVYAALYLTQLVAPVMKEKGKGTIIIVGVSNEIKIKTLQHYFAHIKLFHERNI